MNKIVKRATIVLALTPALSVPASAAFAATTAPTVTSSTTQVVRTVASATPTAQKAATQTTSTTTTTTHTDAPTGSASAVAAEVDGIITIGKTSASAGSSGGSASAHALDLGGQTVAGDDVTSGSKSGAIFATGDTPLGDAELAPWSAKVNHDSAGTQSQAEAALAHAGLLGVLQIWLLHSQSAATWTPDASTGKSSSDGAEVNLADQLDVKVLHAETDSSGKGSSAILVVNDQGILTSDDANGACEFPLDPLAHILCLTAAGGAGKDGTTSSTAEVVKETSGVGLPSIDVTGAASSGGKVATPTAPATGDSTGGARTPTTGSTSSGGSVQLPFTGSEARLLLEAAAATLALGGAFSLAGRRRQARSAL